ncbi:MAG: helix-turn-helix domain-containing protein [Acidiferrobacteraceae bacterium]
MPTTCTQSEASCDVLTHALGHRIRVLRAEHGWSQETLSALTGLHRTYLSQVERGSLHISVVQLAKIARAFALPVGALVDGSSVYDPSDRFRTR